MPSITYGHFADKEFKIKSLGIPMLVPSLSGLRWKLHRNENYGSVSLFFFHWPLPVSTFYISLFRSIIQRCYTGKLLEYGLLYFRHMPHQGLGYSHYNLYLLSQSYSNKIPLPIYALIYYYQF